MDLQKARILNEFAAIINRYWRVLLGPFTGER